MTAKTFSIQLGKGVQLDARKLVDTRMLVVGNSGSGKSWAIRLIAEQAAPKIQTIILDPEGEFASLREKVDLVLVGSDAELQPQVATAAKLARMLLELGVSAVIDLYELTMKERRVFITLFLESLRRAPKKFWRPLLVILDEAHKYCPERSSGKAESTEAVITLISQGRKRGFCGILATQRISKLHKDAAAECVNNLIGRTMLDVDVKRARDVLGLMKKDEGTLRGLKEGQFFGFGPAFKDTEGVIRFKTAEVTTTHPEAGERHKLTPPQPSAKIKKVLLELAELPKAVKQEADDLASAKKHIRELQRDLLRLQRKSPRDTEVDLAVVDEAVRVAVERERKLTQRQAKRVQDEIKRQVHIIVGMAAKIGIEAGRLELKMKGSESEAPEPARPLPSHHVAHDSRDRRKAVQAHRRAEQDQSNGAIGGGLKRMLIALAQNPDGCDRAQLGILAGMSSRSGTFSTYLSRMRGSGWAVDEGGKMFATDEGIEALGDFEPLPTGDALIDHWQRQLGDGGAGRMFTALFEAGEIGLGRDELAEAAGLSSRSGTFSTYLSRLRTLKLADGKDPIRLAQTLLES